MRPSSLLLLLILASLQQLATADDATAEDADCSEPTCGNLTLAYPFWMAGQGPDALSCGPLEFLIDCDYSGSGAFLTSTYIKVLSIDYGNRSFVAVHALMAADEACNITFNVSSAFAITDRFSISI